MSQIQDLLALSATPDVDEISRNYIFDILEDRCYEVICKPDGTFLVGVILLPINTSRH